MALRTKVAKLALEDPVLREHLVPLIRRAAQPPMVVRAVLLKNRGRIEAPFQVRIQLGKMTTPDRALNLGRQLVQEMSAMGEEALRQHRREVLEFHPQEHGITRLMCDGGAVIIEKQMIFMLRWDLTAPDAQKLLEGIFASHGMQVRQIRSKL